jgi:splicing factor 3A subunit 2
VHASQIEYPEIEEGTRPRRKYQFLLFAAEPYEVIAFKVPNMEIEKSEVFFSHW